MRADSAYFRHDVVAAAHAGGAKFSVTARLNKAATRAIAGIDQQAWTPIRYPNAVFDDEQQRWISDAEVAEVPFTAFTSHPKADHVTARLIVRRVKRLNPTIAKTQGELLPGYRYHAVFTNVELSLVEAETTHRDHAVIEAVFADLKNGPLAHARSSEGKFTAKRGGVRTILEHLGSAHDEAELVALLRIGHDKLHANQPMLELPTQGGARPGVAVIEGKQSQLLIDVVRGAWNRLGFDVVDDEAFFQLVLARLVEPTSKLDSLRVVAELGLGRCTLSTVKRCLKRCADKDYREKIAHACFTHVWTDHGGDVSLLMYDVTTLYFETDTEDDLRKVGMSKERRVDPQIVVGLLVDRTGFPLEIACFEGNKAETHTIIPVIKAFQQRHGVADMVVVADAGMLSAANLKAIDEAGLRFIVGSRVTKAPHDLAKHFRWHGNAFTDGQIIDTITMRRTAPDPQRVTTRAEPVWNPAEHPKAWRAVWQYSRKRAARDTAHPDRATQPGPGHHRRRQAGQEGPVREDHRPAREPGRGLPRPRPSPGRAEGLRHQHHRGCDARHRGHRQLPRPVEGRAVLPHVQVGPCCAADLPPHPRRDRGPPHHRVHRARDRPRPASPQRLVAEEDHPGTPPPAARHHPPGRPTTPRRTHNPRRRRRTTGRSLEFRQRAVHWLQETVPGSESEYAAIRHVASRLGISTETLRRWNLAVQVDAKTADASCRSASSDNRCFYS